jgi:hemerythrin
MIKWKDEYALGVAEIDTQHQKLFEISNQAYALLRDKLTTDKFDQMVSIIDELKDYCHYHFQTEEAYMQRMGYADFPAHKKIHDDITEEIDAINLNPLDHSQDQAILGILDYLVNWISNHILVMDKKLPV